MKEIKNAFVYRHIRLDTNEVFYVGISINTRRPYDRSDRSRFWKSIVKKTKYRIEIVMVDLTWSEACKKEIELIKLYGRRDLGQGTLVNLTDGGEGNLGMIPWNKGKKGLQVGWSKGLTNLISPTKGISRPHTGMKGKDNPMYGKPAANIKGVIAIDVLTGNIIGEFKSIKSAGDNLPISYGSVKKILSGTFKSIKGITVKYNTN